MRPALAAPRAVTTRSLHRLSAVVLGAFATLHLANHLLVVAGPAAHEAGLSLLRPLYRATVTEPVLLASAAIQIITGLGLFWQTRRGLGDRWRRASGLCLSFFLVAHTLAALTFRATTGLETNFYWAASVLTWPLALWFVPYYALGIVSLTVHVGVAVSRRPPWIFCAAGTLVAAIVIAGLGGLLYPVTVPDAYALQ